MHKHSLRISLLTLALLAGLPLAVSAQETVEARLRALEQRQTQLEKELADRDQRIRQLEAERDQAAQRQAAAPAAQGAAAAAVATTPTVAANASATSTASGSAFGQPASEAHWGTYEGPRGFVLLRNDLGEVDFAITSYVRYLNQGGLDDTYTDYFGRTKTLDLRNDVQLAKVSLNFKGWIYDPDFRYLFYAWSANANQGLGAQVVLGGYLSYHFNDAVSVAAGIGVLPTTRSTNWTYPNWLRNDNRTMADEYFRGSFTTGVWAWGQIAPGVKYRVMLGNNLSQLGVDSSQLDGGVNTFAGTIWWMPTTGEFGAADGFGDYEMHEQLATMFGVHYSRSREDAQGQPGTENFENSQIRLSDGTLLFSADPFASGGSVRKATYQMADLNAGMKYRGYSLEAEMYWRVVDDFRTVGYVPVSKVEDHGFQLQASAVLIPQSLQIYLSGSKIYGDYGDPWDAALGLNWFPFKRKQVRWNAQLLYTDRSAIGYSNVPYVVGGKGWIVTADFILAF